MNHGKNYLLVGLLFLGGLTVPGRVDAADEVSRAEISRVRYELSKVLHKLKGADGQRIELNKYDQKAFRLIKELAEKHPNSEAVKKLVAEARTAYRASKGLVFDVTPQMLAYRKRGNVLAKAVAKESKRQWTTLRMEAETGARFVEQPFPSKMPPDIDGDAFVGSTILFEDVPYESALFPQSGQNWIAVGKPSTGFYWLAASGTAFDAMFETLRRFQVNVKQVVPDNWSFICKVIAPDILAPGTANRDGAKTYLGWVVEPVAIYIPDTVLITTDVTSDEGATFAGEKELAALISYSVDSVPDDVAPEQLVRIYITALKEKNFDLHLACLDPEQTRAPSQVDGLRYNWGVMQKGIERMHAHMEPSKVGEIVVTRGAVVEDLDSFFGDDDPKKPTAPVEKEERIRVSVRLFDEHGRQTVRQRHITLIRRNGGRWSIYSGATLTF